MKIAIETGKEQMARLSCWRPFFTILPRKVAPGDVRWLEWIERRAQFRFSFFSAGYDFWWEYRERQSVGKTEHK